MAAELKNPNPGHQAEEERFLALETAEEMEQVAESSSLPTHTHRRRVASRRDHVGKSRASRPHGVCRWTLFLLLFITTALGLAGLILSSPSKGTGAPPHSHQDESHQDDGGSQHDDSVKDHHADDPSDHVHHYLEDIPNVARLRDSGEYVLSSSWNRNEAPATREYHWTISDAELNPDGVYRPMILINNQYPGPLVQVNEGDTIIVHLENRGVNATSIHFHGLFQNGTNFMDGTVGVTQCAIAPNSNFTYKFDVHGQSGTYWYHAHQAAQASDGLLGPVVIHSRDEPTLQELDYTTDRIVMIQDYYHNTTSELLMDYLQPDRENEEPIPDNALVNGHGYRSCDDFEGWRCDNSSVSSPILDLAAGQRHRLRFINVGAFAEFQIEVDEHPFYITEVDGTDVHPEPFHRLNILPAQRYSIVVETNVTTSDAYWLRAKMITHCFKGKNHRLQSEIRAIVRYTSPDSEPHAPSPHSMEWSDAIEVVCRDLNTSALHPVQRVTPPPADEFVILRANFMIGAWRLSRGFFNQSTWHPNATHPSLHRFLDATKTPELTSLNTSLAINDKVFDQDKDFVLQTTGVRTVDISINNFDDGAHPFHLHGHKFFVIAQAQSGYPPTAETLDAYMEAHGGMPDNPLRRDTVTVEAYSWAIIRVVLDNPGLWTLHCHNTWHAESGMVMQLLVRSEVVSGWKVEPEQKAMCGLSGVTSGMRPDESIWFGSF